VNVVGLTGFKWIAKMIKDFPNQNLLAVAKFGFMVGDAVRDKDAVMLHYWLRNRSSSNIRKHII
jgi:phosphomannomutase